MKDKDEIIFFNKIVTVITMTIFLFMSCLVIIDKIIIPSFKEQHTEKVDLCTINTGDMLSGGFILGTGNIKGTYYYCCYRILEDGGKTFFKFEMDKTTVYETLASGEQAYVELVKNGFGKVISYNLYIPQDSVIQKIEIE